MREYFCAYHSMLDATRKLSDAEVGRLFRGLLHYSATGEQPDNLQGREEIVFDIFSQQIDRENERYEAKCDRNRQNVTKRYDRIQPYTTEYDRNKSSTTAYQNYQEKEEEKGEEKEKDKGKDKGEVERPPRERARMTPPTPDDVRAYAQEMRWSTAQFDPERFVDFYASKGWRVGSQPMRDWRAAARNWAARERSDGGRFQAREEKTNPAFNYDQRDYSDREFGDDFYYNDMGRGDWK